MDDDHHHHQKDDHTRVLALQVSMIRNLMVWRTPPFEASHDDDDCEDPDHER